jgi:NADH-quinone oxidoreductase subunit J
MLALLAQSFARESPSAAPLEGPLPTLLFYLFAATTLLGAFAVPFCTNLRRAAIGLLGTFAGLSGLYFLLHAHLLAAVELLVGAGGTLPLLLVTLKITASPPSPPTAAKRHLIGAGALALATAGGLILLLLSTPWPAASGGSPAASIANIGTALLSARSPDSAFLLAFELLSVILLIVMIGAAYLAKRHRPTPPQSFYSPIPPGIAPPTVSPAVHPAPGRPRVSSPPRRTAP